MADDVVLNAGSGGDSIAADDIGGIKYQRVKVTYGADGAANDVTSTATNPLPVALSDTDNAVLDTINTAAEATQAAVEGTLTVGSHAVTNAGTFAVQISDTSFAVADGSALGEGILIQGDDGTDRKNIAVDATTGNVQVDLGTVDNAVLDTINTAVEATQAAVETIDNTVYSEDAVTPATIVGNAVVIERDDVLSATPVEGDWVGLKGSAEGALWVQDFNSDQMRADLTTIAAAVGGNYSEDTQHTTADEGVFVMGVRNDTLATLVNTDGDYAPFQVNASGALYVDASDTTQPVSGTVTANPASGTIDTVSTVTNLSQMGGVGIALDNGVATTGTQRVTLASDSTGQVTLAAGTAEIGKLAAGTAAIGKLASNSGVDIGDVDVTSISAGTNVIGDVGISGARTTGGTSFYVNGDVDETEDSIKSSAGQIYWIQCTNLDATPIYLQFYNASVASVTVGTTVADLTFCVPSQGDANGAGFVLAIPNGIAFSTEITVAATTTFGGATGPAANEVILNVGYA